MINNVTAMFHIFMWRGLKAYDDGTYKRASIDLEQALKMAPTNDPRLVINVGLKLVECHMSCKAYEQAEVVIKKLIINDSTSPMLHSRLAAIQNKQGKYIEAEQSAMYSLKVSDHLSSTAHLGAAHLSLAESLINQGHQAEGIEMMNQAIRLDVDTLDLIVDLLEDSMKTACKTSSRNKPK